MKAVWALNAAERSIYKKYADLALPRHTSYPIAPAWRAENPTQVRDQAMADLARSGDPFSLYVHVPFCQQLCLYCACTKEILGPRSEATQATTASYLQLLAEEARQYAALANNPVTSIHLGGGTPTYLSVEQLQQFNRDVLGKFTLAKDLEFAVEIDPRSTDADQLRALRDLGVNRISLGVQDFNPATQQAINRVQSYDLVAEVVHTARALGIASVNFDLIYGLPWQTPASMAETLAQVEQLGPDRIAFYRLAVIPDMFKWQRTFARADLPGGLDALDLNLQAINFFQARGYEFIGLDHFAKRTEGLQQAKDAGELRRNFQGMTTGGTTTIVGLGPSAVSSTAQCYFQNHKTYRDWGLAVAEGRAPIAKACQLSDEDDQRARLLQDLYCYGELNLADYKFKERSSDHHPERQALAQLADDGLVTFDGHNHVALTPKLGRLLVRVVAAVFDAYIESDAYRHGMRQGPSSRVG